MHLAKWWSKSISKGFTFEVCIWVICQKTPKEVSNGFAFGVCNLGNLANGGANLAKIPSCERLCKPNRASKVTGDLLFLSFAKSKCQFPWRWPIFILCILLWEFANNNKCQVNLPKPLEMLRIVYMHIMVDSYEQLLSTLIIMVCLFGNYHIWSWHSFLRPWLQR